MSDKKSLIEIIKISNEISQLLIESSGETNKTIDDLIVDLEKRLPQKVDGYEAIISRAKQESIYWSDKAKEYQEIANRFESYADNLEKVLLLACDHFETKQIEGNDWIAKKVKSSRPKVIIEDENAVPAGHKEVIQVTKIKKDLVLEDLKQSIPIPGARLEQGHYLKFVPNKKGIERGNPIERKHIKSNDNES